MSFTTVAFAEQRTDTASITVNAVVDETHKTSGDDIYIGRWNRLVGAWAHSLSMQRPYLISPSLRRFSRIYIYPKSLPGEGGRMFRYFDNRFHCPVPLDVGESLNAVEEANAFHAAELDIVGVWLADAPSPPVTGEIHTIMADSTDDTTFVKGVWKNHELTFTPDLPTGKYQVVGAFFYGIYAGLWRFNFRDVAQRPGGVIGLETNLIGEECFRLGKMGVWGEFDHTLPPSLDILMKVGAADTKFHGVIDLIKIA